MHAMHTSSRTAHGGACQFRVARAAAGAIPCMWPCLTVCRPRVIARVGKGVVVTIAGAVPCVVGRARVEHALG